MYLNTKFFDKEKDKKKETGLMEEFMNFDF